MIYATGDTHGNFQRFAPEHFPEQAGMTKEDYMIICGDFGGVWDGGKKEERNLDWLEDLPFTTLFISGNHENFDLLRKYPTEEWNGGKIQRIRPHVIHLMRGQVFDLQGYFFFTMGGATSVDRKYRVPYSSWWPQELPDERDFDTARTKLDEVGWKVDCVITHTCSTRMLSPTLYPDPGWERPDVDRLTGFLDELEDRLDYKHWYYGHFHRDGNPDERHTVLYDRIVRLGDKLLPWGAY